MHDALALQEKAAAAACLARRGISVVVSVFSSGQRHESRLVYY
jgi:hypothetical protein